MIYDSQRNYATEFDNDVESPYITFTSRGDISVKDEEYAVSVSNDVVSRHIVLNNNITLTCNNSHDEISGLDLLKSKSDKKPTIYSNNAAKATKVSLKTSSYCSAYGWLIDDMSLLIGGSVMLHNFNISAVCTLSDAYAYGIEADYLVSDADFRGNFTVTSKAESNANSHGIDTIFDFSAKDISGKFKIASTSSKGDAASYGVSCCDFKSEKLSGKFDITAVSNTDDSYYDAYAYGFKTAALSVSRGFTGSMNVKSNAAGSCVYAYAFSSTQIELQGKSTGSISVSAQGALSSECYGLYAERITLTDYSGNISCKALAGANSSYDSEAYGFYSRYYGITCYGDYSGKLNVSAENKNKTAEDAIACGIYSYENELMMDDIAGVWNISAKGYAAEAYGIEVYDNVTCGNISGNKSITAKSYSSAAGGVAYGFRGYDVSIGRISDKITVSATGYAYGFFAQNSLRIKDMSKMNLSVTCSDGSACAINVENGEYDENDGFILGSPVFNFGNVSAVGKWGTIGLSADTITGYDSSRSRVEGSITATSKAYRATGIILSSVSKDIVFSSTVSAIGKTEAYGISFGSGNLILDNARITAKVTGKGYEQNAFVLYTEDSQKNTITITGNSVLTGLISTGHGNDTVYMDSGSKVIGGFTGVEDLTLQINDAKQKNNVLWQATEATSQTYTSVQVEYGLLGEFKIISKAKNIEWTELFSQIQYDKMDSDLIRGNELYTYGLVKKGNDLYVTAMFKKALGDNAEIFETKSTAPAKTNKEYTAFTNKADIKVTDETIALDASKSKRLVLDNNITIKSTWASVYGVQLAVDNAVLISNNAAKTLNVANSGSPDVENATVAGYTSSNKIKIQGGKFLQNITVSGKNEKADTLSVAGIAANTVNSSDTVIAGNFNITGKAANKLDTWGIKTENSDLSKIKDISGKFNISADTIGDTVTAIGVQAFALTMDKFSGKMTIKSSGNADYGVYSFAAGLYTTDDNLQITNGFSGSINVNAKDKYQVIAYGMAGGKEWGTSNADLILGGKNTGSITVTADGIQAATATGIYCKNFIALSNYSGAITAKAVANGNNKTSASAIEQEVIGMGITCVGAFSSKLNVTALNKNKGKGTTYATGISAQSDINMGDITGNWNITATGYDAGAYGLYTVNGGDISVHDISGKITIKATAYNKNSEVSSYAFHAMGSFSANRISGKITVSATAGARGFYAYDNFAVTDMSKMNLSVSGSYAYGIEVKKSLKVAATGLNSGKITVNAKGNAWGVNVSDYIYYDSYASVLNNRLEGNITVKSQNGSAYGISADAFAQYENSAVVKNTEVICSATVSVTGKEYAYGVHFYYGDLTLDNATITAKVTDKNNRNYAYAVYAVTGDNNIYITGKSKITGNICSYDGTDKVSIESGSKLVGGIIGFEVVELIVDDAATAKQALWDVTDDFTGKLDLDIKFDYGMSGDFVLATKKSDILWDDVIDFNDVSLWINGNELDMTYGVCTYGDFDYELKAQGDKLLLAAAERF